MALLPSLCRLAKAWKLPFILVASPPLRETSSLFASAEGAAVTPSSIEQQIDRPVPPVSRRRDDGGRVTHSTQKELKRRGFNAIIRWCAYHQERDEHECAATPAEGSANIEEQRMDAAVVRWVTESMESFSCGQHLVVLTFLCDVLKRQCSRRAQKGENNYEPGGIAALTDLATQLTRTIGLMMTHVVASEQLELQPLFILLAAAYGLHRVTEGNPLQLPSIILRSLEPPATLWCALLHQLRSFASVSGEAAESLDVNVTAEALLTALLLFDESRRSQFFSPNDHKMMDRLTLRLVRLLQPALETSRAVRARERAAWKTHKTREAAGVKAFCGDTQGRDAETLKKKLTETQTSCISSGDVEADEDEKGEVAISLSTSLDDSPFISMRNRIGLHDCSRILTRARGSSNQSRLDLMEYFLCVVHDPAALTCAELEMLPTLFRSVDAVWDVQNTDLAQYVVEKQGGCPLELLAPLLSFLRKPEAVANTVEERLREARAHGTTVDSETASLVLFAMRKWLPWECRAFLVRCCLATSPEVLRAVDTALANRHSEGRSTGRTETPSGVKVLLNPNLCCLLHFFFIHELSIIPFPLAQDLQAETRAAYSEALAIAGAIVRSIDWQRCTPDQLQSNSHGSACDLSFSPSQIALAALAAYIQSLDDFHFLSAEDEMADRTLLNTLVLPLLRDTTSVNRRRAVPWLHAVLPHLHSSEYQRQLLSRAMLHCGVQNYTAFFEVVRYYIVTATELKVFPVFLRNYLLKQRTLQPRMLPAWAETNLNLSKTYTTILIRVLRHLLASGALEQRKGDHATDVAIWREHMTQWIAHYFSVLSSTSRKADLLAGRSASLTENGGRGTEDANVDDDDDECNGNGNGSGGLDPVREAAGGAKASDAVESRNNDEADDVKKEETQSDNEEEDEDEESHGHDGDDAAAVVANSTISGRYLLDEAFTSPVTEDDLENVLTLVLQTGCKASSRALSLVAQRLRDKAMTSTHVGHGLSALSIDTAAATLEGEEEEAATRTVPWLEESVKGEAVEMANTSQLPLQSLPLPAHFVFAVRADSAVTIPITAAYISKLLTTCDLAIFHHVLSSIFIVVKRRRSTVMLEHDAQIAAIAMDVLQRRLTAHQAQSESDEQGATAELLCRAAFKSLVHLLFHFAQLPPRTRFLRAFASSIHCHPTSEAAPTVDETPAEVAATTDGEDDEGLNVVDLTANEGVADEKGHDPAWQLLQSLHAATAVNVLQVAAFMSATQLKEFTLAHLQRLAVFFPNAAAFVFLQVRPLLSSFTQRELLQVAVQYPIGEADVLTELSKVDMHISVDLAEYVPLAKRLPMRINEAIILAHAPFLTIAWVTRVLSALAVRHEEMPLTLLHALLSRVEAVIGTATESDKSLLLLILQGYLLFGVSPPSAATSRATERSGNEAGDASTDAVAKHRVKCEAENRDEPSWMADFLSITSSSAGGPRPLMTEEAQQQRVDLVRHCCDQLLSLERISTLEELRYFLVSYPPSLHQLRERGVVAIVEQKLLPAMLTASPVQWAELDALVVLLADHHVLLPRTVELISGAFFSAPQLEVLSRASLATLQSDCAAVLAGCLRIAAACADAVSRERERESAPPSLTTFPLLSTVDLVLRAFDVTQDWLAALTAFLFPQKANSSTPAATTATVGNVLSSASSASPNAALSPARIAVARRLCTLLLREADDLNPSEFARLVQGISRLRAWDIAMPSTADRCDDGDAVREVADFSLVFCRKVTGADAHSRCVLLKAISADIAVFHRFERVVFRALFNDIALMSAEDLEVVLAAALQVKDAAVVEPLLDAVGTRLLPMMDQCRRSTLVRVLQCHIAFHIDDKAVVMAALSAIERQSSVEVKLDAGQVITVLTTVTRLPTAEVPERLVVLAFQRLEKVVQALSPMQLYQVGQLILELEMGYIPCIHTLVTHILESRDGLRGHRDFQAMSEALCDVFEVEVAASLRASRLRKRQHKKRLSDFYAAQRKVAQEA
jgi:hypothetical protein